MQEAAQQPDTSAYASIRLTARRRIRVISDFNDAVAAAASVSARVISPTKE